MYEEEGAMVFKGNVKEEGSRDRKQETSHAVIVFLVS
jgi:hypothetical protein